MVPRTEDASYGRERPHFLKIMDVEQLHAGLSHLVVVGFRGKGRDEVVQDEPYRHAFPGLGHERFPDLFARSIRVKPVILQFNGVPGRLDILDQPFQELCPILRAPEGVAPHGR